MKHSTALAALVIGALCPACAPHPVPPPQALAAPAHCLRHQGMAFLELRLGLAPHVDAPAHQARACADRSTVGPSSRATKAAAAAAARAPAPLE